MIIIKMNFKMMQQMKIKIIILNIKIRIIQEIVKVLN